MKSCSSRLLVDYIGRLYFHLIGLSSKIIPKVKDYPVFSLFNLVNFNLIILPEKFTFIVTGILFHCISHREKQNKTLTKTGLEPPITRTDRQIHQKGVECASNRLRPYLHSENHSPALLNDFLSSCE